MQALQQAELQVAQLSAALQGAEARLQRLSAEKAALAAAAAAAPAASQPVQSLGWPAALGEGVGLCVSRLFAGLES